MSDSLRDRIAAVIYNELREQSDRDTAFPVMVCPAVGSPNFNGVALIDGEVDLDAAANAVIAALNLAEACGSGCVWQIPRRYEDMTPYQQGLLRKGRR